MEKLKIKCELCGREISKSNFTKHLKSHENGNFDKNNSKYHVDHNDLFCKYCGKECKNKNSLAQHEIRCRENPDRINVEIEGLNNVGHKSWNKGLTKEIDERVKKGFETYTRNHKLGLHKVLFGEDNPSKRLDVKEKISNSCLKRSKLGKWHVSLAKKIHYNYKNNDLHGSWELYYVIFLDNKNIRWERNKKRFKYYFNDKYHYYTPDFYLPDEDLYIEIKGYKTEKDNYKWDQFPLKLKVLMYNDLNELGVFDTDIDLNLFKNN